MMRGVAAMLVIRPNVPALKFTVGIAPVEVVEQIEHLEAQSPRSAWTQTASASTAPGHAFQKFGPRMLLRSCVPNAPLAGCRKRARFRYAASVFAPYTSSEILIHALVGLAVERGVAAAQTP
jgi:hypothetical protein